MIDSFSTNVNEKILYPGIALYENVIHISEDDTESIVAAQDYINSNFEKYPIVNIKNTFFYSLDKINKKGLAENIQKCILHYFAKYCDLYDEIIHTVQWQENIFIDIEFSGENSFIFNPNRSFADNNKIRNTPFSRQVVVEIGVDNSFKGGAFEWPYLKNTRLDKLNKGSILFYPANYLFSKKHNSILSGRKVTLTTFFNGGKDFLAEENGIDESKTLLFSYMR